MVDRRRCGRRRGQARQATTAPPTAAALPTGPAAVARTVEVPALPFEDMPADWGIDFDRVDGADGRRF
ncbi:MAG: hypothetical protein ACKOQW_10070, partial [Phycisphaerales bacterium]